MRRDIQFVPLAGCRCVPNLLGPLRLVREPTTNEPGYGSKLWSRHGLGAICPCRVPEIAKSFGVPADMFQAAMERFAMVEEEE